MVLIGACSSSTCGPSCVLIYTLSSCSIAATISRWLNVLQQATRKRLFLVFDGDTPLAKEERTRTRAR